MPVIGESHTTLTAPRVWEVVCPPWRSGWTGLADVHLCAREGPERGCGGCSWCSVVSYVCVWVGAPLTCDACVLRPAV